MSNSLSDMTLEEAKQIFNILDISNISNSLELKKIYKKLVFLYHPDAHPENAKEYEEKIKLINEAYSILEHSISILKSDSIKSQNEEYEINKKIRREQILTEIVVKSYYQSQNEINQLKAGLLEQYIDKASKASIEKAKAIQSILKPITLEVASKEYTILNKFIKNNIEIFMKEYGLQIVESGDAFLWMLMEPLYFLDFIPDWYEKVLTKDSLPKIEKK